MAENLKKPPPKGILKNSSSFEDERHSNSPKGAKWDEMNILATHHPADKDYGHMKIEEPKTPYSYSTNSDDEMDGFDAELLKQKINDGREDLPKAMVDAPEESDEDIEETPEERAKRKAFERKRKHHYNEFAAVKLARELMEKDEEEEDGNSNGNVIREQPDNEDISDTPPEECTESTSKADTSTTG